MYGLRREATTSSSVVAKLDPRRLPGREQRELDGCLRCFFARVSPRCHPSLAPQREIERDPLYPLSAYGEPVGHEHTHSHRHAHDEAATGLAPALDLSVPDSELLPGEVSRRTLLRGAGLSAPEPLPRPCSAGQAPPTPNQPPRTVMASRAAVSSGWLAITTSIPSTARTPSTGWPTRPATPGRTAWTG